MRLRNGKTTEKRNKPVLEKPVLMRNPKIYPPILPQVNIEEKNKLIEVKDFSRDLIVMLDELNEWDVKPARIAGIVDIYDFIRERGYKLKDSPGLAKFFAVVKDKIPDHLSELIEFAFIYANDEETTTNIKKARDSIRAVTLMLK